ncbi:hypothetical protein BO221_42435 [Archangium sp. Cb G35]|nr:hypothetical protein BO221_42435 [Archangium sp. Cb G35]
MLGTTRALPAESVMPLLRPIETVAGRGGFTLGARVSVLPSLESESVFSASTPATVKLTVVSLTVVAFTGFEKSTWMGVLYATFVEPGAGEREATCRLVRSAMTVTGALEKVRPSLVARAITV